ncbi:MAG: hypothetical protein AABX28_00540 [Nanoarchaeota archaeon]
MPLAKTFICIYSPVCPVLPEDFSRENLVDYEKITHYLVSKLRELNIPHLTFPGSGSDVIAYWKNKKYDLYERGLDLEENMSLVDSFANEINPSEFYE